jgi:FdhE protein
MTEETPRPRPAPRGDLHTQFAVLPDPATLFARRADRFAARAEGHELAPYLRFMAGIAQAQAALLPTLPPLAPVTAVTAEHAAEHAARAAEHGMPPIDRARLADDPALGETISRFLQKVVAIPMPDPAAAALARLRADPAAQRQRLADTLEDAVAADAIAEHVFIAAALQLHAARLAALLQADLLKPVGTGVCPACGGAPVACVLVDRPGAHNARYCVCATCATQWNSVRVTCVLCGATEGIAYHHIEGSDDGIAAETCNACQGYVKLLSQAEHPELDPMADDVASLGLDLLLQDAGWRRGAVNPFLTGY